MAVYSNRRIFYATQAVGFAPISATGNYISVHGAQSVGINTNFTLENVSEIGQLSIYQIVEQIPDIEVTVEKFLDGYPLLYHLSTPISANNTLVAKNIQRSMMATSIYADNQSSASGTPLAEVVCSGLYFQSATYNFGTDQSLRESVTLVGNNIFWYNPSNTGVGGNQLSALTSAVYTPNFLNTDSPLALAGSGGVQIRRDIIFNPILGASDPNYAKEFSGTLDVNKQSLAFFTNLPPDIEGISSSGTNDQTLSQGQFNAHINNITISCNAQRPLILELGRKEPYYRFMNFPVPVTAAITTVSRLGNQVSATELGSDGLGNNLSNRSIRVRVREGTWIDLGHKNKLQSCTYAGGDTTGGQVNCTYSYITYNDFLVSHPQDPSNANAGLGGGCVWPY